MSIHIIIDGYNLIRRSNNLSMLDLQDIRLGRKALVDMLAKYKRKRAHRITVVFDGSGAPLFSQQHDRQKGISIIFSHGEESADTLIKEMATRERQKAMIVSSDKEVAQWAASCGATTISANDFENRLTMSVYMEGIEIDRDDHNGWKPTTKKKGPSRRLSKRQRRNMARTRKL